MVKSNKDDKHEFSNICLHDFSASNYSSPVIKGFVFFFPSVQGGYPSHGNFITCFRKEDKER